MFCVPYAPCLRQHATNSRARALSPARLRKLRNTMFPLGCIQIENRHRREKLLISINIHSFIIFRSKSQSICIQSNILKDTSPQAPQQATADMCAMTNPLFFCSPRSAHLFKSGGRNQCGVALFRCTVNQAARSPAKFPPFGL